MGTQNLPQRRHLVHCDAGQVFFLTSHHGDNQSAQVVALPR